MEFRLLGPIEITRDGRTIPLRGAKQRALLAMLVLHANEAVSRDTLLEELWPGRPDAGHSLDIQVSRLRKALAPAAPLVTRAGGYALELEPDAIDVHRFERLLADGRDANAAGKHAEASATLDEALSLWRGPALADVAYESFARTEVERLEELRLAAVEERCDARLALGRHQALVPELEELVAKHPLRELLRGQLMLALYRSGRQPEALSAYAEGRRRLVEELGLEPGPALRQLEQAILRQDASLELVRASRLPRGRRRALVAASAFALAAGTAAAGVVLASGGTESSGAQPLVEPGALALVSARSGKLVREVRVQSPVRTAFGGGALWAVSATGTLTKIEPASGRVLAAVNTGAAKPCGLAVGEGAVWVTDCTSRLLARVDPVHGLVRRITLPRFRGPSESSPHEVALGAGSVWVEQGDMNPSWLVRLDPATGRVRQRIRIPEVGADALASGVGALWVASGYKGHLTRIDSATGRITGTIRSLPGNMCCVAVGGGFVWAATGPDRKLWKLDEHGIVLASIPLPASPETVAYADGAVWIAAREAGVVVRVDPTTDATRSYALGHPVVGVAAGGGLVAIGAEQTERDITAGLTGKVVRVALGSNELDWSSTDPAVTQFAYNPWQVQFQQATCAKLLTYPDATGPAGRRLVPEVASALPTASDGGRTYTFTIRPGYRFSPPSNEPVTSESFRHAIERYLSPVLQPGPWHLAVLADVVGAGEYHAGRTAHVAGVTARGSRLVVRLSRPAPDLAARLALPVFCAVPAGLPVAYLGLHDPIPSAGPYFLAARSGDVLVLKRNPGYHGPRPHGPGAIVYRQNVDVGTAVAEVEQGRLDLVMEDDPALGPTSAAARAAGSRYRLAPDNEIGLLALNPGRPLFAGSRARRAVGYAIDRRRLAGGDGIPTSRLLTPNLPSSGSAPFPLNADLRIARKLLGRARLHAVLAAYGDDAALAKTVRDELAAAGITVTIVALGSDDDPATSTTLAGSDLALIHRDASQTVDAVSFLESLPYLPAADRARLAKVAVLASTEREAAAAALAGQLEQEAVYASYVDYAIPELVSKRLGCAVHQPAYPGLDLAAICVRGSG